MNQLNGVIRMNHQDHVDLLRDGIQAGRAQVWADFGSGSGAFTLALAALLPRSAAIYSIDHDRRTLEHQERLLRAQFPDRQVTYLPADFTRPLELPPMDGIVMANALHFQRKKEAVLNLIKRYLRPSGRFILVEYNVDRGNHWVPYPLSYPSWEKLAVQIGFQATRLLAVKPSRFLGQFYSALSLAPTPPLNRRGEASAL